MSRSMTEPDMPGRCQRCWLKLEQCLCRDIVPRRSRVRVLVIRHFWEARKSTNTARVAGLALENLELLDMPEDPTPARERLAALASAWFLYPGQESPARLARPPDTLVVLDGTWRQTRRMLRRLPELSSLPLLGLNEGSRDVLRLRAPHRPEGRSTLESIAEALQRLGDPDLGEELLELHRRFVERTLIARSGLPREAQEYAAGRGPV